MKHYRVITAPPSDDSGWLGALSAQCDTRPNARYHCDLSKPRQASPAQPKKPPSQKKPRISITPAIIAQVVDLVREDMTYREVAEVVGISSSEVGRIAAQQGVGRGRGRQKGGPTCRVPDCGRQIAAANRSGVCKAHSHAAGYCQCQYCEGQNA